MRYFVELRLRLLCVVVFGSCAAGVSSGELALGATKPQPARVSQWGYDKADATPCLRAAMGSGAKTLLVDNIGSEWVLGPIQVSSNLEIIFADGVVVRAKKGDFQKPSDSLFDIKGQRNVTLRGEGRVRLVMNKADYQDPSRYKLGGHRHTVNIVNSQNVLIQNLTLQSSGGDGVYVGSSGEGEGAKNVTLDKLVCLDHHRQGISVTGAENLLITDCKFNDTKGTAPQCGIDYEPNYARFSLVNCVARRCDFDGNADAGVSISLHQLDATSKPVSILFENCRMRGNQTGVQIISTGLATPQGAGRIEFDGCTIADTAGSSLSISEHQVDNLALVFRNLVIDNRKSNAEAVRISSGQTKNLTGLKIEGLTAIDDHERAPLRFISRFSNGLVDPVVSGVKTRNSAGVETPLDCAAFVRQSAPPPADQAFRTVPLNFDTLRPVADQGRDAGGNLRFRQKSEYLQWAKAGQKFTITFTNKPVHRFELKAYRAPLEVVVRCPSRAVVGRFGIPFDGAFDYTLDAAETGVYRFEIDARMQTASVKTDAPGQAFSAAEPLYVFGCSGRLYFHVPAGVKDIRIEAGGSPHEASTVYLLDPQGKQVDAGVKLEGSRILQATRPDASAAEIWSIRFTAAKLFLRIGAPLAPLFSSDPANLLLAAPAR